MKRILLLCVLLLVAFGLSAQVKVGGITDGYFIAGKDGGTLTAGQDVNIDIGPVFLDLTGDWTKTLWDSGNTLALTYALGFVKSFGIFSPSIKLTGDRSYDFAAKTWTGDLFSDLEPQFGITYESIGLDLYSDLSFEEGYNLFQTFDGSAYLKFKLGSFRVGLLYMDPQAVTDDVGYPNSPAAREGVSFYTKASISY